MKNLIKLLCIFLILSCNNLNSQIIKNTDVIKFKELLDLGEGVIIDVRTPNEFCSGHIKDATNLDYYSADFLDKLKIIQRDVPIYVYCRSGGRSLAAAKKMEELGFSNIFNLKKGISSWNSENLKTIKSESVKNIVHPSFNISQIRSYLKKNEVVVLYFNTEWCVPCRKMKPIIDDVKSEFSNLKFILVDADTNKNIMNEFKVVGIPVVIIFKDNIETFRNIGIISKKDLKNQIAKNLLSN